MSHRDSGWRIEAPEQPGVTIVDMPMALLVACNLARAEYQASGHPTAVKVWMHCGDGVLMGHCG